MWVSVRQMESSCVSSMVGSARTVVSEDACIDMTTPRSEVTAFIMQFRRKMPIAISNFLIGKIGAMQCRVC